MSTKIEWTDATWNPLRARNLETGQEGWACARVSPGCQHCYAATQNEARRFDRGTGLDYTVPNLDRVEHYLDERVLEEPLRWRKPRRVFVCSMTDLFGEWVTDEQLDQIFAVMALAQGHTFQVLTKRPERMRAYASDVGQGGVAHRIAYEAAGLRPGTLLQDPHTGATRWPLRNVWGLVSCENQDAAGERVPILLDTPLAVRGVSAEPLLGPIDFRVCPIPLSGPRDIAIRRLDWVIVGGESGPRARPMDIAWARSIVEQCRAAGVACFVKQLGSRCYEYAITERHADGRVDGWSQRLQLRDRKGGDISEFPADLQVREYPREAVLA